MHLHVVLGNQLFHPKLLAEHLASQQKLLIFMREDWDLCTYYQFHKQKIYLFLTAMRHYSDELRNAGYTVVYQTLTDKEKQTSYEDALLAEIRQHEITSISVYEIEDKFFEDRLLTLFAKTQITIEVFKSPMFLTSRADFARYLQRYPRPFMKTFYEWQRKRLGILVDDKDKPVGGQWSFDADNRKALPHDINPPALPQLNSSSIAKNVKELCTQHFADHPGALNDLWLPVTRGDAKLWLTAFLKQRFQSFGPFEDAIPAHSDFVFHSVLTPCLNTGLLTPAEVVDDALSYAKSHPQQLTIASLEGFIRQVIGWREFIRGIYQNFNDRQQDANFFKHKRKLSKLWYGETPTGIPPLDRALAKVHRYGYAHHIERLMVCGSLMVLLEINPKEAHRWFMEMFIDSSDWVMGPNVYGMALFADGGIFATKPYICGSNYYRKMSGDKAAAWCDGVDGLYWSFIEKHHDFFAQNPRLSMITRTVAKMSNDRKAKIYAAADNLRMQLSE